MKPKLLYFLLATLIITNGVMLFMLVKKPHKKHRPAGDFLMKELNFSNEQKVKFNAFKEVHHTKMKAFDTTLKQSKDVLFNSFGKTNVNVDSLTNTIGTLEAKKDKELFLFFSKVKSLCTDKQAKNFNELIRKARKKGRGKPPRRE